MTPSEQYPIEVSMFTENRCYQSGKRISPIGIQVHSVGCKGTTRERWRAWNNPTIDKCPNAFIDTAGIMQTLPWEVRPWLSGKASLGNANDFCIGFEMCEPLTKNDTPEVAAYLYGAAVYICSEWCKMFGVMPDDIRCHAELHRLGVASNHADVGHWWGKKGTSWEPYTMDSLRADVKKILDENGYITSIENVPVSQLPTLRRGNVGTPVTMLQNWLNAAGQGVKPDGQFGPSTEKAVKSFQKSHGLSADGVVGRLTWQALSPDAPAEPDDPEDEEVPEDELSDLEARVADIQEQIASVQEILNEALSGLAQVFDSVGELTSDGGDNVG